MLKYARSYGLTRPNAPLLTVLLTLKGRSPFTRRWLEYANRMSLPFAICIADGSSDDEVLDLLDQRLYPNISLRYLRFTPDEAYPHYYAKIRSALQNIESEFCLLADNDDFYSLSGIQQCIDFLQANGDFSACQGLTFQFNLSGEQSFVHANSVLFGRALKPFYDLSDNETGERITTLSRRNIRVWYSVQRTADMLELWQFIEGSGIDDLFLAEMAFSFGIVARGKVKCLVVPYYFRQHVTANSSNEVLHAARGSLAMRIQDSRFQADTEKIATWLVHNFSPVHGTHGSLERVVKEALNRYMTSVLNSGTGHSLSQRLTGRARAYAKRRVIDCRALSSVANLLIPYFDLPRAIRKGYQADTSAISSVIAPARLH